MLAVISAAKETYRFDSCVRMTKDDRKELVFPVNDAESRQIRLHLTARFEWPSLSGYTFGMKIFVNGRDVNGVRLLNKPLAFKTRNGGGTTWSRPDLNRWNVVYSPDFSDQIKKREDFIYGFYEAEQEPFAFVLDLSGLTIHGQENTVTIIPQYTVPVVFRDVRVEIDEHTMPRINEPKVAPAPDGPLPDCTLRELPFCAPSLKQGDNRAAAPFGMPLTTRLGVPGGDFLNITPDTLKEASLPFEQLHETPDYILVRRIEARNSALHITDTFRNRTDKLVGVRLENSLKLEAPPAELLRSGVKNFLKYANCPANPTVFARMEKNSVGIVVEDDILRVHSGFFCDDSEIGFIEHELGIPPNGQQTLEWSIYRLPASDYYDFINLVRRDWGLSFTWTGPQEYPYFGSGKDVWQNIQRWVRKPVPESTVRQFLANHPVRIVKTHVAADYSAKENKRETPRLGHGTAIPHFTWWCDMTANMAEAFRKYAPQVEVYAYLHKNLCTEVGNRGKYTDSEALDQTSRLLSEKSIEMRYVPTVANSYGKALAETYRHIVEKLGCHVYLDEVSVGVTAPAAYEEWDGCSVQIDPSTNEVLRKVSYPNLLTREWLEQMLDYLHSKGRKLLCNTPPHTRTLLRHRLMHFVEAGVGESGLMAAHLSTPLGFDYARGEKGFNHFRTCLKSGALALPWSGKWSECCFPFTPLELRPGYIIGEERIITSVSGRFGWNDSSDAEVFVFDGAGRPAGEMSRRIQENGQNAYELRMPGDHVAVIVKKSQSR